MASTKLETGVQLIFNVVHSSIFQELDLKELHCETFANTYVWMFHVQLLFILFYSLHNLMPFDIDVLIIDFL